ncbi:pyridoxal phosphate-dependent decarboxylase family protein [Corynebacterium caspium]|uniref:pyridoxal phosphate-dependent decarboxylase family protein n=1 Tax=Corynebacterium caspium TaxID=234828 RepID=UPI0003759DAD|nr:aminotransferase class I/II-fold pyridoxal phosphate-dependent enzyme [Corynebacterium caspium]WKD59424.1 L-2,4-diaminobutyrate decarboxylase [Corynebacterium caspium DSM 44850]
MSFGLPNQEQTARIAHRFIDRIFFEYGTSREDRFGDFLHRQENRHPLDLTPISAAGRDVADAAAELVRALEQDSNTRHPRFFGFIPGPAQPVSWLGAMIASAYNSHVGGRAIAPGASAIEEQVITYLAKAAGYGEKAGGLFVSGGSMANLTAMIAARDYKIAKDDIALGVAYVSTQTHSSVRKALRLAGISSSRIRQLPVDEEFRMRTADLAEAIAADKAAGLKPFVVVGTCGTTNTGSVDPLNEIADICEREDLWFHVDGAYGASVLLSKTHNHQAAGVERSHSLSWDGHKWLYQTYGCAMLLVRDVTLLTQAFSETAEYLQDIDSGSEAGGAPQAGSTRPDHDWWDLGPELTRPARAARLWLTLQAAGSDEISDDLDGSIEMAEVFAKKLGELPDWEIASKPSLAIVCFRYVGKHPAGDKFGSEIAAALRKYNIAGIWSTELNGHTVLRLCTISPEQHVEDIKRLVEDIEEMRLRLENKEV